MARFRPDWQNLAFGLVIIGLLWFVMGLHEYLVAALAVATIASTIVGGAAGTLIWGVGLLGVGALAWLHFGNERLGIVVAVIGVIYLALGAAQVKKRSG
jgi:hypothetical protein